MIVATRMSTARKASNPIGAAAGAAGMVLGQVQDIAAETAGTPLTLDQINDGFDLMHKGESIRAVVEF